MQCITEQPHSSDKIKINLIKQSEITDCVNKHKVEGKLCKRKNK